MRRRHLVAIGVGVAVAVIVWLARQRPAGEPVPVEIPAPKVPANTEGKKRHDELARKIRELQSPPPSNAPKPIGGTSGSGPTHGSSSGSGGSTGGGSGGSANPEPQVLDAPYIRGRIQELMPLLKECYELSLRDRPELGGKLLLEFEIAGEPSLGGVVESAEIVRESDGGVVDQNLEECVRATIESQTFAPPEKGGRVKVRYPFVFQTK